MTRIKLSIRGVDLIDLLLSAGWPVWPLLALSVMALALVLERAWYLRRASIAPPEVIEPLLAQCQNALPTRQQTVELAGSSLLGHLMASAIERVRNQPLVSDAALRQSLEIEGRVAAAQIEKHLPTLATIASVATLMGLLGTVVGMIDIFAAQAQQGQQPAQLAQGISVALYNTALGLLVSIPSLLAWRWLKSRAEHMTMLLEVGCERLLIVLQQLQRPR